MIFTSMRTVNQPATKRFYSGLDVLRMAFYCCDAGRSLSVGAVAHNKRAQLKNQMRLL